ncbi:MAG: M23 family metallopeptidase, partial [Bacteroidales bacterium]|nr:M23 family metallopeptidase [Bacteroidales bacterium]
PTVVLTTIASIALFSHFKLGIYALPFNMVVILFLYVNKLRVKDKYELKEVKVQHNSPEKNLYYSTQAEERFMDLKYLPISLPIKGQWHISQAHNGEHTHKEQWKHAWDFVITTAKGLEYKTEGNTVSDYLCYDKTVVAAYGGYIQEIANGIEDNNIGQNDLNNNWGNTIIIKHTDYLYSKYSHLKKGSILLHKGDWVRKGQAIAKVGNSGRSPYPHLHFQMQATPYIGSETIKYPFSSYITKESNSPIKVHLYDYPKLNQTIETSHPNELLSKAFKFDIGKELVFDVSDKNQTYQVKWLVKTDIYNSTFLYCQESQSYAYFHQNNDLIYFKNFNGDQKSALYQFFLAFNKLHHSFYEGTILKDEIALHLSQQAKWEMIIQDFIAPFYLYLKTQYTLKYIEIDDELSPSLLKLESCITHLKRHKEIGQKIFDIKIHTNGIIEFQNKENEFYAKQKKH